MTKEEVSKHLKDELASAMGAEQDFVEVPVIVADFALAHLTGHFYDGKNLADDAPKKDAETQEQEDPLSPAAIVKNLANRRQKAKAGVGHGRPIPQVKVEAADVAKALNEVTGVTEEYLDQHGFLTHVYRNAAARTQTDITKIDQGLMVKFE